MGAGSPAREKPIVANIAVSPTDQPASPADRQASLRAELLGQLVAAQFDLETVMAELVRTSGNTSDAQNQLQFLGLKPNQRVEVERLS